MEVSHALLLTEDLARTSAAGRVFAHWPEADLIYKNSHAVMAACLVSLSRPERWPKVPCRAGLRLRPPSRLTVRTQTRFSDPPTLGFWKAYAPENVPQLSTYASMPVFFSDEELRMLDYDPRSQVCRRAPPPSTRSVEPTPGRPTFLRRARATAASSKCFPAPLVSTAACRSKAAAEEVNTDGAAAAATEKATPCECPARIGPHASPCGGSVCWRDFLWMRLVSAEQRRCVPSEGVVYPGQAVTTRVYGLEIDGREVEHCSARAMPA